MKYTIAIPAYKAAYLERCIQSILQQNFQDFELVIVNDHSPENLTEIVRRFENPCIRYYINERNCGAINVVDNWNVCLGYAQGDFIILMGDDDELSPDYLEAFNELMDRYPGLDVYHCRSTIIDTKSDVIDYTPSWPNFESVYENMYHRLRGFRLQFISDFVYRTNVLKQRGGFYKTYLAWSADDISSYIAMEDKGIAHTQRPVFNYRRSPITISNSGNIVYKLKSIVQQEDWMNQYLISEPQNKKEQIIHKNIIHLLPKQMDRSRIITIKEDMKKGHRFDIAFSLFSYRKTCGITFRQIITALIWSLK